MEDEHIHQYSFINSTNKNFLNHIENFNLEQLQQFYNENPQYFIDMLLCNQLFFFLDTKLQQKIISATKIDPKKLFEVSIKEIDKEIQSFDVFFNNSYADEKINNKIINKQHDKEYSILSLISEKQLNFTKEDLKRIIYNTGYKSISSLLYEYINEADDINTEIIDKFIEFGANLNIVTKFEKMNLLMICLKKNSLEIAKYFIEKGIDINHINNDNENALSMASQCKQNEIIRKLLNKGCSLPSKYKYLPYPVSLEEDYLEIRNEFKEFMIPIDEEDQQGNIILHYICMFQSLKPNNKVFLNIFNKTKDKNHQNKDEITPFGYCLQMMNQGMIDFFLNYSKQNNFSLICNEMNFLLFTLKQRAFDYVIQNFEKMSSYLDSTNEKYQDPLFYSVIYNYGKGELKDQFNNKLFYMLLETDLYDLTSTDYYERSILHYAGMRKNKEIYDFLVNQGLNEDEKDYDDKTAKDYLLL